MSDISDARFTALTIVLGDIAKHLGMRPQDFKTAFGRVTEGSDGTPWQDWYCESLEALIGFRHEESG